MDIFEHLMEEHRAARQLFGQLESADGRSRQKMFGELQSALTAHMKAEERILYKRLEKESSTRDLILAAYEEHRAASRVMGEMPRTGDNDKWRAKLKVLNDMIEHHLQEEEGELFEKARAAMGSQEPQEMLEKYEKVEEKIKKAA